MVEPSGCDACNESRLVSARQVYLSRADPQSFVVGQNLGFHACILTTGIPFACHVCSYLCREGGHLVMTTMSLSSATCATCPNAAGLCVKFSCLAARIQGKFSRWVARRVAASKNTVSIIAYTASPTFQLHAKDRPRPSSSAARVNPPLPQHSYGVPAHGDLFQACREGHQQDQTIRRQRHKRGRFRRSRDHRMGRRGERRGGKVPTCRCERR